MKTMKRTLFLAAAAVLLGACGPQTFTMNMEMRHPSLSGLDLGGKSLSVVYLDAPGKDTVFSKHLATGFAEALEKDYFEGREAVAVYRMEQQPGADYASRDTLLNLILDSGDDVVFLFDVPVFEEATLSQNRSTALDAPDSTRMVVARVPYSLNLYAYDSMNKADTVRRFVGNSVFNQVIFGSERTTDAEFLRHLWDNQGNTAAQAADIGAKSAAKFKSVWKGESFSFYYYDDNQKWIQAAEAAYDFQWKKAVDLWMSLLSTSSYSRRSRAAYNLASAFYLMGDMDLAAQWLDQSDRDEKLELSAGLRKRILNHGKN